MPDSTKESFTLDSPHIGILLPKFCWHTMQYSHDSVQMCIASMEYDQEDYVKDYEVFKKLT